MSVKEEDTFAVKEEEVSESAEVPVPVCRSCNNHPCVLVDVEAMLQELFDTYTGTLKNPQIRHKMYTQYTHYIHDYLGSKVREKVPSCVERRIRSLAPSKTYTGFKRAYDEE